MSDERRQLEPPSEALTPPKPGVKDHAITVVGSVVVGLFGTAGVAMGAPFVGPIAETVRAVAIKSPIERRREHWCELVAELLRRHESILTGLETNEAFVSAVARALPAALRTHHEEKLLALRNAVVNAAIDADVDDERTETFIRYVDELLPSHLSLLALINEQRDTLAWVESFEKLNFSLLHYLPPSVREQDGFRAACQDLQTRFLVRIAPGVAEFADVGSLTLVVEHESTTFKKPNIRVTSLGAAFLRFVAEPR